MTEIPDDVFDAMRHDNPEIHPDLLGQLGARPRVFGKSPDMVLPGDIVIPSRGRYQGVQCEVKDVLRGKYATYRIKVVPVIPLADEWSVDYTERVRTVHRG